MIFGLDHATAIVFDYENPMNDAVSIVIIRQVNAIGIVKNREVPPFHYSQPKLRQILPECGLPVAFQARSCQSFQRTQNSQSRSAKISSSDSRLCWFWQSGIASEPARLWQLRGRTVANAADLLPGLLPPAPVLKMGQQQNPVCFRKVYVGDAIVDFDLGRN